MALCRTCSTVIPCHCHLDPPVQLRPGVYLATEPYPRTTPPQTDRAAEALDSLFRRLGPPTAQ